MLFSHKPYCSRLYNCCHWQAVLLSRELHHKLPTLDAGYKPSAVEQEVPKVTLKSKKSSSQSVYSLLLPPPNVTGDLHLGHALTCTIQDVLTRWHQSQGKTVSWIPGTDHAGIATQVVVEKRLQKERSLSRHDLGRERFIELIHEWRTEKQKKIKADLSNMNLLLDWDKEYFTLDAQQSNAVTEAFIRLHEKGLIYRSNSLVNWSCALESAISDIEVDNINLTGPTPIPVPGYEKSIIFGQIYDVAYKICRSDQEVVVSTTRPETLLGDVAVAVHPNDPRYANFHGSRVWHPFQHKEMPIVFDESVDPAFGTGAVKVTPAHDKTDFALAKRHNLLSINVFDAKGEIDQAFGDFKRLRRFDARENIIQRLIELDLYRGKRPHAMSLPVCSRSKDIIEYMIRPQWYVRCDEMCNRAMHAVTSGDLKIHPEHFVKDWHRWLKEQRDWCISRQLWWGHRIPAYECVHNNKSEWVAARDETEALQKAQFLFSDCEPNSIVVTQDPDVLDTWFSSSLLPFSSQGWPNKDLTNCPTFPIDVMETGHDILFFWVARMVMLSQSLIDRLPFKDILLHGIVCDAHGRKMSKSLGNVILPAQVVDGISLDELRNEATRSCKSGMMSEKELEKTVNSQKILFPRGIPECGTDALRFTLCSHNVKSHFINFDVSECYTNKLFLNKIWQATRFTLAATEKLGSVEGDLNVSRMSNMDRWILNRLAKTLQQIDKSIEEFNFHIAAAALKTFFYGNFCDVYIESTKPSISAQSDDARVKLTVLHTCLRYGLNKMGLFTPFVAAKLTPYLVDVPEFIANDWEDDLLEQETEEMLKLCAGIRQLKSQHKVVRKQNPVAHILIQMNAHEGVEISIKAYFELIKTLSQTTDIVLHSNEKRFKSNQLIGSSTVGPNITIGLAADCAITNEKVTINQKKIDKLKLDLEKLLKTVSSEGFMISASEKVKQKSLERVSNLQAEIELLEKL